MAKSNVTAIELQLAAHLRDAAQAADPLWDRRRIEVYRELTRNNVYGFLDSTFPISAAILAEHWPMLRQQFVAQYACHSPLFLEIPAQFLDFMQHTYPKGLAAKGFINELLHYEWLELAIATQPATALNPWLGDSEQPLYCYAAVAAVDYRYPVQQLGPDYQPTEPPAASTSLLLYRDAEDEVTFMQISAPLVLALKLLQASDGLTITAWLTQLIEQCSEYSAEVLQQGLFGIVPELIERGIIGTAE